jgi:hypothetical protein
MRLNTQFDVMDQIFKDGPKNISLRRIWGEGGGGTWHMPTLICKKIFENDSETLELVKHLRNLHFS